MENLTNKTRTMATAPNFKPHREGTGIGGANLSFSLEALAPCLADLKQQLALRLAMP